MLKKLRDKLFQERPKTWTLLLVLLLLALAMRGFAAHGEESTIGEDVLQNQLNVLESQSVQRKGGQTRALDLLNRQDDRIAGQTLNSLKTRNLNRLTLPPLERQLDRSRRPVGSVGAR